MRCILMNISGSENRKLGKELGEFLCRSDRHFQVATGNGLKLGALCKQGRVPAWNEICELGDARTKFLDQSDGTLAKTGAA
jgi:hypothetical protein